MTRLSINVNKIALIRNSRGTNFPNLVEFVEDLLKLGVKGITIHPRPDQRHIRFNDVYEITTLLRKYPDVELNIEGYPDEQFMKMIRDVRPAQCTLVPDSPTQLTSDHGWDKSDTAVLLPIIKQIRELPIRLALFIEPNNEGVILAKELAVDAVEIYTEFYASRVEPIDIQLALNSIVETTQAAKKYGLIVNAGHDLNLKNLGAILKNCAIDEVSIGHAFTIECIYDGLNNVVQHYLTLCKS